MGGSVLTNTIAAHPEWSAILVLVVGVVAARLASGAVGYGLGELDSRMARITTSDTSALSPRLIALSRTFVFWLVIILAVALALRLLGAGGDSVSLNNIIIDFVPRVLVAFVIVVAGHLLGLLASNLLANLNSDMSAESIGPQMLHGVIVAVAVVMGLQHLGVDITFITNLLLIIVAISGGGLMLAFALGARRHVANLLARRELNRLTIGEHIRVDDIEGQVVEIYNTSVDVATKEGLASIPAARFAETSVTRLRKAKRSG